MPMPTAQAIKDTLKPGDEVVELDHYINDPPVADRAAEVLLARSWPSLTPARMKSRDPVGELQARTERHSAGITCSFSSP